MNIAISTIYKCCNFGSFFQAFALQETLSSLGHEVTFLNTDGKRNHESRRRRLFSRTYPLRKNLFSLKSLLAYRRDWKRLNVKPLHVEPDCVVIGSDEIWNIRNCSFERDPSYYGLGLNCPAILYAPSLGGASWKDFSSQQELLEGIASMSRWSARDKSTEEFLRKIDANRHIQSVLDPSFLIDWTHIESPVKKMGKFILVYTYDGNWGMSSDQRSQAMALSRKLGLPLVSFGFLHDWCDKSIACSPLEFLAYLRQAPFVITDTFHGTVMSLQYHKHFACLAPEKQKIQCMAEWLGLDMHTWNLNTLTEDKPYSQIDDVVNRMRSQSLNYLTQALSDIAKRL